MNLPRNLIETDWFRIVATFNPISYLIEGIRSLIIVGWDARGTRPRLRLRVTDRRAVDHSRGLGDAEEADEDMSRSFWSVAFAVAWRVLHNVYTTPSLFVPGHPVPALLLHRLRGRALARRQHPGLRLPARLHGLPVRVRPAPVRGFQRRVHRFRGRARLRIRLCPPPDAGRTQPNRASGGVCARGGRPLAVTATILTLVALVAGMEIGGNGVDLFALYSSPSSSTLPGRSGRPESRSGSERCRPAR